MVAGEIKVFSSADLKTGRWASLFQGGPLWSQGPLNEQGGKQKGEPPSDGT